MGSEMCIRDSSTLVRDFQVPDVVDLTPGSGAACIPALYSKVSYVGFVHNEAYEDWLLDLVQRMFVAMVLDSEVGADKELIKDVGTYLNRVAQVAKFMLPKETSAFGDSLTGGNDSDADEI